MHIILTHEHADFDAIASLVGAWRLYPEALAIVPQSVNQNVHDFLTLYWDELPLVEFGNRPRGPLSQITMVDSQYIPPVKGRRKNTALRVIDHHSPGDNLPPAAEASLVETGATVTYLVEQIARANLSLPPTHATLMLLGIYEDTGSLTYNSVTPRDIRAAAWLLEHGARLDVLRDFLNYPLNSAQKRLYNAIINNLNFHTIQGRQILISAVHSNEYVSEVSSLAHKLRDIYNPDGLFLLVAFKTSDNDYIQLVARSSVDDINVGQIAENFAGGGHPRAAAAHIDGTDLEQAEKNLLKELEKQIKPAVTVEQIMSYRVRTVSPTQTIQQAADMMTRYGHEGYPVVKDNQIVGILSRREIDKALHHQLGKVPVEQYMHAGEIYVTPQDTVEHLQQLMLQERVGQIPVVEAGKIIGVVTRTDLINLWNKQGRKQAQPINLSQQLKQSFPPGLIELLKQAGQQAAEIDCALYIVGGVVRDLLLNRPVSDIDLVVEGNAIALAEKMQALYGGRVRSHSRFGTANWIIEGAIAEVERLDFVTARTEFYRHPTALPEVEQSSIKQDLHRRDFTINTLAIRLNPIGYGNLLDFYGGYQDLKEGLIRVLHSLSFVEDPTRILRAIRLEQRLGFHIGKRTLEHLNNARDLLMRLSADRIFSELEYTLREAEPEKALVRLTELKVLQTIQPGLIADDWFCQRAKRLRNGRDNSPWAKIKPEPIHYLGLLTFNLSTKLVGQFMERLRVKRDYEKILRQTQTIKAITPEISAAQRPSEIYHLLKPFSNESILINWLASDNAVFKDKLAVFSQTLRHIEPEINGAYLKEQFSLRPSPIFTEILTRLRNARLDGEVASLAEEHTLVDEFLAKHPPT